MRRVLGTVLSLLLLAPLSSCGGDEEAVAWPIAAADRPAIEGLVWAKGNTFGDLTGPLFEVDPTPQSFVPAGGGIYYGSREGLQYADGETVVDVGRSAVPTTLRSSPDRRWLAFIDEEPHPDEAVVVDTRSGTEVLRTSEQMEDGTGPDDLYPDGQHPRIEMVDDDVVWIRTDEGYLKYDLESGDLDDGPFDFEDRDDEGPDGWAQPWFADRRGTPGGQGFWNPSRTWYVTRYYEPGAFISADDRRVPAKGDRPASQLDIRAWVDDDTAYGFAGVFLITCALETFTCTKVPGAEGTRDGQGRAQRARLANGWF